MFKGTYFFRDTTYFFILVFLIRIAYVHEIQKQEKSIAQAQQSSHTVTLSHASVQHAHADTYNTKHERSAYAQDIALTQNIHTKTHSQKHDPEHESAHISRSTMQNEQPEQFVKKARKLLYQLAKLRTQIQNNDEFELSEKNKLLADIKELKSQTEHYIHEYTKHPAETRFLLGPLGSSAQAIKELGLQKKLNANYAKTNELIALIS